ncbi:MAG: CHAT domain-containing protein [Myxococcota bacterium]
MLRRSSWVWLVLATALLALAVVVRFFPRTPDEVTTAATERPPPPGPPLEVLVAGCSSSTRTPATCELAADDVLTLWIAGKDRPRVQRDGAALEPTEATPTRDPGWRMRFEAPEIGTTLTVHGPSGAEGFRIDLRPAVPTPRVHAVRETLRSKDGPTPTEQFQQALGALDAMTDVPIDETLAAALLRIRILHRLGRLEDAAEAAQAGFALAVEHHRHSATAELGLLLVPQSQKIGNDTEAHWGLDRVHAVLPTLMDAGSESLWSYYRGEQALKEGDQGAALQHLTDAERTSRRLGLVEQELSAASLRVGVLGMLGREDEQQQLVQRMLALIDERPTLTCNHAAYLNGAGSSLLYSTRAGDSTDAMRRLFERAAQIFEPGGGCEVGQHPVLRHSLASLQLNLALETLARDALPETQTWLEAVTEGGAPDVLVPWMGYTRARLELAREQLDAAGRSLDAVEADPQLDYDPMLPWQVAVLRGDLERARNAPEAALTAYLHAEQRLDELVRKFGIDQGREGLLAGVHTSAAQAIALLLARGDRSRAAALARSSRARALRPMGRAGVLAQLPADARETWLRERESYRQLARRVEAELLDAWSLPADARQRLRHEHAEATARMRQHMDAAYRALDRAPAAPQRAMAPPPPGEAWLLAHPLPRGWAVFMLTDTEVLAHSVPRLPPLDDRAAWAATVLEPFASVIEDATQLAVLPMGPLVDVPVHVLPWRDDLLMAALPVVYKLDIGAEPIGEAPTSRAALVVSDPATRLTGLGRLPAAREEGAHVTKALTEAKWQVTTLEGEAATHGAVTEAIATAELLHYAGHGQRRGLEGWDSAIPLAGEASLDVRDVLALPRAPTTVVLSGCETGLSDAELGAGGMHLAGAFLAAGSHTVIAAADEVPDTLASALGHTLYEAEGLPLGPAQRLRRALLSLRRDPEAGDGRWEAYRAFVP